MVDRRDARPMVEVKIASLAEAISQRQGGWIPVFTGMIIKEWE